MDKKGKNRYFILVFSGLNEEKDVQKGKIEFRTSNGKHANEKDIIDFVHEMFGLEQIFISNIMELTEGDFKDWIEGRDSTPSLGDGEEDNGFL